MSLKEDANAIKEEVKELSLAWELLDGCKKSNKRMFWIIIVLIIAWLSTIGGFMYYITNYGYEELSDLANKDSLMMDSVIFIEDYLDDRFPRECHYSKTIGEFAEEYPYGKYAITTNGHITALIDGVIYDTFDPSNRIMRCAWRVE